MNEKTADEVLARAYRRAKDGAPSGLDAQVAAHINIIAAHGEKNKGVLAMCMTLMLKKALSPGQDIRLHQANMSGGFSARGLDSKFVTPFLRHQNFPFMASGSGALTRSLEQAVPFGTEYPGKIKPPAVREAFLGCIARLQDGCCDAEDAMHLLLHLLIVRRDRDTNLKLIKPKNRSIAEATKKLGAHFAQAGKGGARLPVLAIYAAYRQMIGEVAKYRGGALCDLQPHTSADRKSGFLGDIQVNDGENKPVEVVEIKHGSLLTPGLAEECYDKFKTVPGVRTYYLLSTDERADHFAAIGEIAMRIYRDHGCQFIANGILSTLRYYLRLISSVDNFLDDYVGMVEQECNYDIKTLWQKLWESDG